MARFLRYETRGSEGQARYGELREDSTIQPLDGAFGAFRPSGNAPVALDRVKLLAPVTPSKIIAIGPNFNAPFEGPDALPPMELRFWVKPPNVLNHPEGAIELPPGVPAVNHEVELAVVVGQRAKQVSEADAEAHIFGYTCMNEVCAGDFATPGAFPESPYFVHGKIYDGFGPLGPWIETDLDTRDLRLETRVNGEVRQSGSTDDFRYTPAQVLSKLSDVLTLLPGDVISMGSPPGVAPFADGDTVEVEVEGIGVLRNHARKRPDPA